MERILHSISTLWVYARRDKYRQELLDEDRELAEQEVAAKDAGQLSQVRYRRDVIADELRGLSAPLTWRSFIADEDEDIRRAA